MKRTGSLMISSTLLLCGVGSCRDLPVARTANDTGLRRHVIALSNIGPRVAGTSGEENAAQYVEEMFREIGYSPSIQPFSSTLRDGTALDSANIMALKPGSSSIEIIVGAHYDSADVGRGVDDNASGVAIMLEVAQDIQHVNTPFSIRFIAFGAEELGLIGSNHYVDQMTPAEIDNTAVMINLDSLVAGDVAYAYGDAGERGVVRDWALAFATERGFALRTQPGDHPDHPAGTAGDWGDSFPFHKAGIQYAYFESTNWDLGEKDGYTQVASRFGRQGYIWHTTYDTIDYIDKTFPGRIDERLHLFETVLYGILTEFEHSD